MKYLLLDTNIYLHYTDFEQIDWAAIVNDSDYTIIVPFTVIREIDKYKDGLKCKIKARAKSIASKFGEYFLDETCHRKCKIIQINDPSDEIMSKNNLNWNISDDVIIGSALGFEYQKEIIVISHDNTLLIKAKKYGLKFLQKMPEKYLIKEEKTDEEKELEKCHKELMQLKNRQPKPKVLFANNESVLRIKKPDILDIDMELDEIMSKIKADNPYAYKTNLQADTENVYETFGKLNAFQYFMYSEEQFKKHNDELDKYYACCEKYYRFKLEIRQLKEHIRELKFVVINDGNAETGAMNIFLEFPEGVNLYNDNSIKQMDDIKPKAPLLGTHFSELGLSMAQYICPGGGLGLPQLYCFDLTKCLHDRSIIIDSETLIHHVPRPMKIENSIYIDTKQCGNFPIKWKICAAGCADAISGTLNVIIESD